ncbi:oligosaccharide flippase family protein [uncultured Aquimarina sp.]|uniref:oligosaccharide flippase family protein n=1 Tax=uncultured Aquimarina sp. TaxID=575652 RepID=UPI00260F0BCD|nr:oligosaccharide flippase family protein [uncultured Aquimarina sp.]
MSKIKGIYYRFRKNQLFKNFISLFSLQGVNMILPFLTLPYLGKVLGTDRYGVVLMVYAVMQYLFVFCDYGFNLSATKDVSIYRDDKKKINEIFSNIYYIKLGLIMSSFVVLFYLVSYIDVLKTHRTAYFLGFGIVIGQVLNPIWLFQGMERMKYITIVNVIAKGIFTGLIFLIIKTKSDYIKVPLLYSIGFMTGGIISILIALKQFDVAFTKPNLGIIKRLIKNSTQYFLSRSAAAMFTSSNTFVSGLALGDYFAGIFGAAERLFTAMTVIYTPLGDTLYPYMAKNRNMVLYKKILISVLIMNLVVAAGVYFFSSEIVFLVFGEGFEQSSELLKLFCYVSLIYVPSVMIGYPLLGALGKEKYANYSVVFASVLHMFLLFTFYEYLTVNKIVYLLIFAQSVVFTIRIIGVRKLKLKK